MVASNINQPANKPASQPASRPGSQPGSQPASSLLGTSMAHKSHLKVWGSLCSFCSCRPSVLVLSGPVVSRHACACAKFYATPVPRATAKGNAGLVAATERFFVASETRTHNTKTNNRQLNTTTLKSISLQLPVTSELKSNTKHHHMLTTQNTRTPRAWRATCRHHVYPGHAVLSADTTHALRYLRNLRLYSKTKLFVPAYLWLFQVCAYGQYDSCQYLSIFVRPPKRQLLDV